MRTITNHKPQTPTLACARSITDREFYPSEDTLLAMAYDSKRLRLVCNGAKGLRVWG